MPISAAFKSQEPRKISQPILQNSPPVGSYNPDNLILGKIVPNLISRNNGIQQRRSVISLHDSNTQESVAFSCQVKRFENLVNKDQQSPIRGPGHYDLTEYFI